MSKYGLGALRLALAVAFLTTAGAFLASGVYNGLVILMALLLAALLVTIASVRSFLRYMAGWEDEYGRPVSSPTDVLERTDRD